MSDNNLNVNCTIDSSTTLPFYATVNSAGVDLKAMLGGDELSTGYVLRKGCRKLIKTGLKIALPRGFEAQVRPRSGLAYKHGVTVLNSPGTIDADYRGDIGVILINHGDEDFVINHGDRIAQLVVAKHEVVDFNVIGTLDDTERGEGGFGSTGQ